MMNKEEFIQLLQDKKYKTAQNILSEMNDMDTAAFLRISGVFLRMKSRNVLPA